MACPRCGGDPCRKAFNLDCPPQAARVLTPIEVADDSARHARAAAAAKCSQCGQGRNALVHHGAPGPWQGHAFTNEAASKFAGLDATIEAMQRPDPKQAQIRARDEPFVHVVLTSEQAELLKRLVGTDAGAQNLGQVLALLVSSAARGVLRPGSWERGWIEQVFGEVRPAERS